MLKSTGVLRRVDELGRIVIPKEIRKNLKIKNGESLEIFIDSDSFFIHTTLHPFLAKTETFSVKSPFSYPL